MLDTLFILKRKEDYSQKDTKIGLSTGLYNSSSFINEMLNENHLTSQIEVVVDNNCIDRVVSLYKPKNVIIEALWVVPSKITELQKLHPSVTWIIRLHSDIPFLANEGIAMEWIFDYLTIKNVKVALNSPRIFNDLKLIAPEIADKLIYLPNYYPQCYKSKILSKNDEYIDIACFGAVRPLKNHLEQAVAAIQFADSLGKKLRFHINGDRIEMKGQGALRNLTDLFLNIKNHELITHDWMDHEEFLLAFKEIDILMQVSFSESFNIVAADAISEGVPIITSAEIPWASRMFVAEPTDTNSILKALVRTYTFPGYNLSFNQSNLKKYTDKVKKIWIKQFKENQ